MAFFYENFIAGGAYLFFLRSLGVTLLITAFGLLLGTISGVILCILSRSPFRVLRAVSQIYFLFMGGTPILLVLMLFYYVILAPAGTSALVTSIIAFGLRSGALLGEIMKSALNSVDAGQILAARTLGFSRTGAFFYITLPQAIRFGKPLYRHSAITLLQDTSVVGYITVNDLTRVVSNMGSRTGNPLMSLAVGIVLYLLLSSFISLFFQAGKRRSFAVRVVAAKGTSAVKAA